MARPNDLLVTAFVMMTGLLPACAALSPTRPSGIEAPSAKIEERVQGATAAAAPALTPQTLAEGGPQSREAAATQKEAQGPVVSAPAMGLKEGSPVVTATVPAVPPSGEGAPSAPVIPPGQPQYVSLNFDNADLELVLRSVADITGINFIIGPGVKANITMRTATKVSSTEIFSILESILEVNNLVAVKEGSYYKIVPIAVAQQEPQDVQVGKERGVESERYVTQIVRLDHLSADEMSKILQSFLAKGAKLVVHKETNSLIIAGFTSTVRRLLETVRILDVPTGQDNIQRIFVYFVENVRAADLANTLNALYGRRGPTPPGARPSPPGRPGAPPPPPPAAPGQPPPPSPGVEPASGEVVGEMTIVPDEATNALVIRTSPRNYEIIKSTITQIDIVPKQVIIEALLAEVDLTDELKFSLEAFVKSGSFGFQQAAPGGPALSALKSIIGANPGTFIDGPQGFTFTFVQSDKFRTFLNNVAAVTKVNILAAPHLLTANNKEAKLQIGQEVPIITNEQASLTTVSTAPSTTTPTTGVFRTLQQKDIGILLGIKPHVNEKRLVTLDIETEQTDVLAEKFGDTGSPAFSKRSSKTSIVVQDGQSIVIGGIIQNRKEKSITGIPFLSRIPLLGYLFRNTKDSVRKTELLILITPHVIASPEEGRALTEQFTRRIESVEPLLRSLPKPSPSGLRDE